MRTTAALHPEGGRSAIDKDKGEADLDYHQIGGRVREIRIKNGMTQEQLAEAANLSVPYISHIERGFKRPSLETLMRVAGALHVTADCLLSGLQPADRNAFLQDIEELLDDCSLRERRVLLEVASALKRVLRETA